MKNEDENSTVMRELRMISHFAVSIKMNVF